MLRQINHYCSTCLRTRKFVNLPDRLVCQACGKRLWRREPPAVVAESCSEVPRRRPAERLRTPVLPFPDEVQTAV